jgi:gliding motility-associated-like protein
MQGEFNIAFLIEEWRQGTRIGYVTRDMQVEILACNNSPPVILSLDDTCVTAGETISFDVRAFDPDGDSIYLSASGGPFGLSDSPAFIDPDPAYGFDETVITTFTWETNCAHVQNQPYQLFFKAEDHANPVGLVTYKTIGITVVCPAPENLTAEAVGSTIRLKWNKVICSQAAGYRVYRRIGSTGFVPGVCETGVPASTGYVFIHQNSSVNDTAFTDDDNGNALIHGNQYCYLVTAYFQDGAESYASNEACANLKRDIPVITNVSNDSTDLQAGRGFIAWSKPTELDTVQIPGPYQYVLYRSEGSNGDNLQPVATLPGLIDTMYYDNGINLNTSGIPYSYRVALESLTFGFIGNSQLASSIYIGIYETDEELQLAFQPVVPWINDYYVIYRRDEGSAVFDSVGYSIEPFFNDTGLVNGEEYCYFVKSVGGYTAAGFVDPIINFSQVLCAVPYDNKPPCPPELAVTVNCDLAMNTLNWNNPNESCADDVLKYLIFFSPYEGSDFSLIDSTSPATSTTYDHVNNGTITGCYAVIAVDSTGNKSQYSNFACIDNDTCSVYSLPNVFTPNFDGYNDVYGPIPYTSVERVDMTIYNRWGGIVYETEDPDINWDGKEKNTSQDCSDGVYFYVCKVYEITLYGIVPRELRGSITLIRE